MDTAIYDDTSENSSPKSFMLTVSGDSERKRQADATTLGVTANGGENGDLGSLVPTSGGTSLENRSEVGGSSCLLFGEKVAKNKVTFTAQLIAIFIVIVLSGVNLTLGGGSSGDSSLWVALLSSALGYVLPSPVLKYHKRGNRIGIARQASTVDAGALDNDGTQ